MYHRVYIHTYIHRCTHTHSHTYTQLDVDVHTRRLYIRLNKYHDIHNHVRYAQLYVQVPYTAPPLIQNYFLLSIVIKQRNQIKSK